MFDSFSRRYKSDEMACILMCHILDIPFYFKLYQSISNSNDRFNMGLYLRQMNNRQYQYKTFCQTITEGELNKTKADVTQEIEIRWSKSDISNKNDAIEVVGYDPFDGYSDSDRRFLFNELVKYFDDDIGDDAFKVSQVVQVVINNNQIRKIDLIISGLDPTRDADQIKQLSSIKSSLIANNDKIAKENEISVKNRSNKEVGRSTLTYLMKDMRLKDIPNAEANYYDQLRSPGTQWAADMSFKSIKENTFFDENDKLEIFVAQRELIERLQSELDDTKEALRLKTIELEATLSLDCDDDV